METSEMHPIKNIFIVEDNELYAKSLQSFLYNQFPKLKTIKKFRIGELCLLELYQKPEIVVLDFMLNSKYAEANSGLDIILEIKRVLPDTDVIVLSSLPATSPSILSIKKYYSSYICKNEVAFENLKALMEYIVDVKYQKNNHSM